MITIIRFCTIKCDYTLYWYGFFSQEIDGKSLLLMKRSDVLMGLALRLGPALKIYAHVERLQTRGDTLLWGEWSAPYQKVWSHTSQSIVDALIHWHCSLLSKVATSGWLVWCYETLSTCMYYLCHWALISSVFVCNVWFNIHWQSNYLNYASSFSNIVYVKWGK